MEQQKKLLIIGGGITGLSAGITWAKNMHIIQNPVIIVEKQPAIGGYVKTIEKEGYLFDVQQFVPNIFDIINYFGIKIKLKQFQGMLAKIVLVDPITKTPTTHKIPASIKGFEYWLINSFPSDASKTKRFFKYIQEMYQEVYNLKSNPTFLENLKLKVSCRRIMQNKSDTFKQLIDTYKFTSPEILELLNLFAYFSGMPSERVSGLLPVININAILEGAYRSEKSFEDIPKTMHSRYASLGGTTRTNTTVSEIIIENRQVKGVKTREGEVIEADYVISTVDPSVTFGELIKKEQLVQEGLNYLHKIEEAKKSASALQINLGLDDNINLGNLGLDNAFNLITTGKGTFENLYKDFENNDFDFRDEKFQVGVICPNASAKEKKVVVLQVMPVPLANWNELHEKNKQEYKIKQNKIADFFIAKVEKYLIPNLSKHIVVKEIFTPHTFGEFAGTPTSAVFGMAPYPNNFGLTRLKTKTPISGLLQPQLSHGIQASLISGMQAIDIITNGRVMNGYLWYRKEFN